MNPLQATVQLKQKHGKCMPDVIGMSMLNGLRSSYDRDHITGASSSPKSSSVGSYPMETLNPPPSEVTIAASTRTSSSSRHRPYKLNRPIYEAPFNTPCSTDVCDESDYNYPLRLLEPFPPPPTPGSHCHSDSCPPSPSSKSSYIAYLPPPPSPV